MPNDGRNLYAYVGGDPTNARDPTGKQAFDDQTYVPGAAEQFRRVAEPVAAGVVDHAIQTVKEGGEHLADHVDVSATAGLSAIAGASGTLHADKQTFDDGTLGAEVKVGQTNKFEAQVGATLNYRIGDKDIGAVSTSASVKVGLVGIEVKVGENGANATVSVGPQIGVEIKTPVAASGGVYSTFPGFRFS